MAIGLAPGLERCCVKELTMGGSRMCGAVHEEHPGLAAGLAMSKRTGLDAARALSS
jgi:hypothetical protein